MKLWVVQHGCYSDRHVVAVTAEQIAALDSNGTATCYELNEMADRLLQGYRRWRVTFRQADGACVEKRLDYDECNLRSRKIYPNSYPNPPSSWQPVLEVYVNARDEAEALKIAADERRVWLAVQPVPTEG